MTDDFLIDIRSQPETLRSALGAFRRRLDDVEDFGNCRRVVLAGSGDSLIAATAVESLFRAVLGVEVRAVSSLDAAAFEPVDDSTLLVAISVSGEVSRTVEAALRFRAAGAVTAAVTANPEARLGVVCDHTIDMPKPLVRSIPHARGLFRFPCWRCSPWQNGSTVSGSRRSKPGSTSPPLLSTRAWNGPSDSKRMINAHGSWVPALIGPPRCTER